MERSACVLVCSTARRASAPSSEVPPLEGRRSRSPAHLRELAEAGADEAILVLSPITEASIRALEPVLSRLDG